MNSLKTRQSKVWRTYYRKGKDGKVFYKDFSRKTDADKHADSKSADGNSSWITRVIKTHYKEMEKGA